MIFEPKTDFSERDISLDTLNEERRFWAKEGDSKFCDRPSIGPSYFVANSRVILQPSRIGLG
ncbi:hypothetical protein HYS01_04015 [Candidatus Saccharibacteria bacterium]|nr:hypothetical protein [Candidatus Saccharibacteria bacterium]